MANMVMRKDFVKGEVMDLSEVIALVSPTDTPLTTLLMSKGYVESARDITVMWREKELNNNRDTLIKEGATAGDPIFSSRRTLSNTCQILEKVTEVSGTAQALEVPGMTNLFYAEVEDRLQEMKRDMEWYFINGTRADEADDTPRQMNGLLNLINDDHIIDGTGGITEDLLLDTLQKMWERGAIDKNDGFYAFVNVATKRQINKMVKTNPQSLIVDIMGLNKVFGVTYNLFKSDFGNLNLIMSRHIPEDTMLIVDLEQVQIAELRSTFYEDLPVAKDAAKGHVINESTIKLLNSYAGAKIINLNKKA